MKADLKFHEEAIQFIIKHEKEDLRKLALKKSPFHNIEMKELITQIQGRQIAKNKFPFLLHFNQYIYPPKISLEQASSEITAKFKSKLISGKSFVDLTGGMGIDAYLLGKSFQKSTYVEPNQELCQRTKHNYGILKYSHCTCYNTSCEAFLELNDLTFDWAYLDPSRRIEGNRKISIHNYEPNVVELQDRLNDKARNVMIKLSPMQDVSKCVEVIKGIKDIYIISVKSEVKELLLCISKGFDKEPRIHAVDISSRGEVSFSYDFRHRNKQVDYDKVQHYLYQPSPSLIKSELQNRYNEQFGIKKLHPNTQLYTSKTYVKNYFGRVFKVRESIKLDKKILNKILPNRQVNVISKNFPLSSSDIINKYNLRPGGELYLIAFTNYLSEKKATICERIH